MADDPEQDLAIVALERDEAYKLQTHYVTLVKQLESVQKQVTQYNHRLIPQANALRLIGKVLEQYEKKAITPEEFIASVRSYYSGSQAEVTAIMRRQEEGQPIMRFGRFGWMPTPPG